MGTRVDLLVRLVINKKKGIFSYTVPMRDRFVDLKIAWRRANGVHGCYIYLIGCIGAEIITSPRTLIVTKILLRSTPGLREEG